MAEYICYVNGKFLPRSEASVSMLDRAFLMGDAVYEVLRVHRGKVFRSEPHYRRMVNGLRELRIQVPFSKAEFEGLCAELVRRNEVEGGTIYLQVSRGVCDRTHLIPEGIRPTVVGFSVPQELPLWKGSAEGVDVITTGDLRWARCEIKTTMLLPNSLAKQKARDAGAFEAVLVADDGVVREGCSTNLFAFWEGALRTHPLNGRILGGITREVVLEIARAAGVAVVEETFNVDRLLQSQEVFLTGTGTDVYPVMKVDGRPIGAGRVGSVTSRLMELFDEVMEKETGGQDFGELSRAARPGLPGRPERSQAPMTSPGHADPPPGPEPARGG